MSDEHLVLAGGGHTHALILRRWCMKPHLKPQGLITLINRHSTTLYSGMIPGLIADYYNLDEVIINLRSLSEQAGISFVMAEIIGINLVENSIYLQGRPPIHFKRMSLDIGSETSLKPGLMKIKRNDLRVPIKPLDQSLKWIEAQDNEASVVSQEPLTVIGSGLSAVEVVLALRNRWGTRPLQLQAEFGKLHPQFKQALFESRINVLSKEESISGPALLCTGNKTPDWLLKSQLPVDRNGRVMTTQTLQVINHPNLFAVGDCGVIKNNYRSPSGVWAVRAADFLASNLERSCENIQLIDWSPQKRALQLIGRGQSKSKIKSAWALWGGLLIGPHYWLWKLKEFIDKRFIASFQQIDEMRQPFQLETENMGCRGCAAKLPAKTLKDALEQADLSVLGNQPEDAAFIASLPNYESIFQSVDGFPALVSDPWLNGRLTALHACSDLWSMGARVLSAQVVITLPNVSERIQQELLAQSLSGIKSALEPQGAKLIGGHSLEARSLSTEPISLGIQIDLCINGVLPAGTIPWGKGGFQSGDELLISRALGSGVLFAAARARKVAPEHLDSALEQLSTSQHKILESLLKMQKKNNASQIVHACTDITGFGLLGHLEEMLSASNSGRVQKGLPSFRVKLQADLIPHLSGALSLLGDGYFSTLAPSNRRALRLLNNNGKKPPAIELKLGNDIVFGSREHYQIKELIVDPQTCGPLLIACPKEVASELVSEHDWIRIGSISTN